ncbi:bifunctional folylpolyglutamate synthase/dihydrofolate synthase [Clostridium polynesiense]|uniref:bifunctional folylpolyglutamate synthase/dihydrofolate synthase n=1 Tax=Clostridium polynesiense TaxID=1325933 RepID=UPI00058C1340|nr:folylpolyglutamate synthase/dihydrofolate synthase family protein [Clostridium polynesiense]
MRYVEAIEFLNKRKSLGTKPGLDAIENLLDSMGNPQNKLKFVHVAGTNGKGSTAAFIASILKEAGYRVGVYNSPYLVKVNEIIRVNDEEISDYEVSEIITYISKILDKIEKGSEPSHTEFEIVTSMAFQYFVNKGCDIVVLEVGMGGRLDATNIISVPEAAVITPIGIDHTAFLGDTLEKIAFEKAGIIKKGGAVVVASQHQEAQKVIERRCREENAYLSAVQSSEIIPLNSDYKGQKFNALGYDNLEIKLLGSYQRENAALALKAIEVLQKKGYKIDEKAIYKGLYNTRWAGRFELLRERPIFIRDGAHNNMGVAVLVENLKKYFPGKRITFIIGILGDKSFEDMLSLIAPIAAKMIMVTPKSPRALPAKELAVFAKRYCREVIVAESIDQGVKYSVESSGEEDIICAFGSLYFISEIKIDFL